MKTDQLRAEQPIGIFDSGVGGLTVANAINQTLPNEQIIYFGDTAHLPYGDKAPASIRSYTLKICEFLIEMNCKMIVVACNTASSIAAKVVEEITKDNLISVNVIDPTVNAVALDSSNKRVGVIGTKGTIQSGVYKNKLLEKNADLEITSMATPLLVPVIEEMLTNSKISKAVIEEYLSNPQLQLLDVLILGCTHYPLIRKEIEDYYGGKTTVMDSANIVAQHVQRALSEKALLNTDDSNKQHRFYVSDYTESFESSTHAFFSKEVHLEERNIWL